LEEVAKMREDEQKEREKKQKEKENVKEKENMKEKEREKQKEKSVNKEKKEKGKEREKVEKESKFEKETEDTSLEELIEYPELVVGNTHNIRSSTDQNCHHWKIYVRTSDTNLNLESFIKKVVFKLHPTFSPQKISLSKAPFELSRYGWGTFHVGVHVHWKDGKKSVYKHHLNFSKDKTEDVWRVNDDRK